MTVFDYAVKCQTRADIVGLEFVATFSAQANSSHHMTARVNVIDLPKALVYLVLRFTLHTDHHDQNDLAYKVANN